MGHTEIVNSRPHTFGPGSRQCRRCSSRSGLIRKYHLMLCRQCFRDCSELLGFKKFS
jgi:small subunit ribosomal protein S29e